MNIVKFVNMFSNNTEKRFNLEITESAENRIVFTFKSVEESNGNYSQFELPVKKIPGFSWKVYKKSIGVSTGKASDLIELFSRFYGETFARKTIDYTILSVAENVKRIERL